MVWGLVFGMCSFLTYTYFSFGCGVQLSPFKLSVPEKNQGSWYLGNGHPMSDPARAKGLPPGWKIVPSAEAPKPIS